MNRCFLFKGFFCRIAGPRSGLLCGHDLCLNVPASGPSEDRLNVWWSLSLNVRPDPDQLGKPKERVSMGCMRWRLSLSLWYPPLEVVVHGVGAAVTDAGLGQSRR